MRLEYRYWVIPLLILVTLVAAWWLRWEHKTTLSQTDSHCNAKMIWKHDRWTGQVWVEVNGFIEGVFIAKEFPANRKAAQAVKNAWIKRNNLTRVWYGSTGIVIVWLLYEIRRSYRQGVNQSGRTQGVVGQE